MYPLLLSHPISLKSQTRKNIINTDKMPITVMEVLEHFFSMHSFSTAITDATTINMMIDAIIPLMVVKLHDR